MGKGQKDFVKCVHGFILGVKRPLAVIKGQLNCGEVKGDWLVSGEGVLAGVTGAAGTAKQGCTCRKWQGWGRAQGPTICRCAAGGPITDTHTTISCT